MDYTIIDAHAHLWLRQDTVVDGLPIRTLENGRSEFMGEIRQMVPPFMIDGVNSAEVFLSNMDYAQVAAAVITQEFIDGIQNDYLGNLGNAVNFQCCAACDLANDFGGDLKAAAPKICILKIHCVVLHSKAGTACFFLFEMVLPETINAIRRTTSFFIDRVIIPSKRVRFQYLFRKTLPHLLI